MNKIVIIFILLPILSFSQINEINWHRGSTVEFGGINSDKAYSALKARNIRPKEVIVAIICDGVDTTNSRINGSLLRSNDPLLSKNKEAARRVSGTVFGWNFLGSKDAKVDITSLGTESFREMQKLHQKYGSIDSTQLKNERQKQEYKLYLNKRAENRIDGYIVFYKSLELINQGALIIDSMLRAQLKENDAQIIDINRLNFETLDNKYQDCLNAISGECSKGLMRGMKKWKQVYDKAVDEYQLAKSRVESLGNPQSNPRFTLGDDPYNIKDRNYGNTIIMGEKYDIGTALSGVIAAKPSDNDDVIGIYTNTKIMIVKALPDGEAFDKDIYNSILFAVDNGAKIIVLSSPKSSSSQSAVVEKALRYAAKKDVLVIIPAGDKGQNIDEFPNFPLALDSRKHALANVIRVGGSNMKKEMFAKSGFGQTSVDLFCPADVIASVYKGGEIAGFSGTSLSAANLAGAMAMIRAYYPEMRASQIKSLALESIQPMKDAKFKTKNGEKIYKAETLSKSGGILDLEKMIEKIK